MNCMADIAFITLGALLLFIGVVGSIVPIIPGPLVALAGFLCARGVGEHAAPSGTAILIACAAVGLVEALDYVVPAFGAKKFHCGKLGILGCVLGTLVGLFFMPLGLIIGPFLGAFLGEVVSGKEFRQSLMGAAGAFVGYVTGILLKLICCGVLAAWFVASVT